MVKKKIGRALKEKEVCRIDDLLNNNGCSVIVGQKPLFAKDMQSIRRHMAIRGCTLKTVRRSALEIVLTNRGVMSSVGELNGNHLMIFGEEPMSVMSALSTCSVASAKWLGYKFAIDSKHEIIESQKLIWMSTLPDPETIKREFLGILSSPLSGTLSSMNNLLSIVSTLIASKLGSVNNV